MILNLEQLKDAIIDLPADERVELAKFLVDSFDEKPSDAIRDAWLATAKERLEELRSGKVKGIPAEEVLKNLRIARP